MLQLPEERPESYGEPRSSVLRGFGGLGFWVRGLGIIGFRVEGFGLWGGEFV